MTHRRIPMIEAERIRIHGKLQPYAYPEEGLNWWQGTLLLGCGFGLVTLLVAAFAP